MNNEVHALQDVTFTICIPPEAEMSDRAWELVKRLYPTTWQRIRAGNAATITSEFKVGHDQTNGGCGVTLELANELPRTWSSLPSEAEWDGVVWHLERLTEVARALRARSLQRAR